MTEIQGCPALEELLAPLFGKRTSQPRHRHRPTGAVAGATAYDGWEVARCSCGQVFRRDSRMRWMVAPRDWLAQVTGGRA